MTREEKIAKAKRLRDEGLTYAEIAEQLGVTASCVQKWLNPERTKEWLRHDNARPERKRVKRQWEKENRAECPQCGGLMGQGTAGRSKRPELCRECRGEEARHKRLRYIELRGQGLTNLEIEAKLGLPFNTVGKALTEARQEGLDVPPPPYWERGKAAA